MTHNSKAKAKPNTFPAEVFIKVIGKKSDSFEPTILKIIQSHIPHLENNSIKINPSKNENYLSITVKVMAENQAQLDAIYHELSLCDQVILSL